MVDLLTMLIGTNKVLLCARVDFAQSLSADELERACVRIDDELRREFTDLDEIFIEPVPRSDPSLRARVLTLLLAVVVLGGLGYLIGVHFAQQLPSLIEQLVGAVHQLRADLTGNGVGQRQLDQIETSVVDWVAFFLLYDGERIWRWLISPLLPPESRRVDLAGRAAWATITGYVRGTAVIATIHGTVIGLALFLLGVPLALPLAVVVFLGSFIPFVGALVGGGLAILVPFGTQGWLAALILLGVLLAESQLEVHLLQPLIVGRYVRLHPLAIGLAFAVGTVLAGIVGAIIAVPTTTTAVIHQAWPALRGRP